MCKLVQSPSWDHTLQDIGNNLVVTWSLIALFCMTSIHSIVLDRGSGIPLITQYIPRLYSKLSIKYAFLKAQRGEIPFFSNTFLKIFFGFSSKGTQRYFVLSFLSNLFLIFFRLPARWLRQIPNTWWKWSISLWLRQNYIFGMNVSLLFQTEGVENFFGFFRHRVFSEYVSFQEEVGRFKLVKN